MADRNEEVMEMVRREIDADPEVGVEGLMEKAKGIDPAVGDLTRRQFHARYPLQVKRARSGGGKRKAGRKRAAKSSRGAATGRTTPGSSTVDRDAIRGVFLEFASDFAQAESRQEIVAVLSSVDTYVERVQKLVGK